MKNNLLRVKVDFEHVPVMDSTRYIRTPEDLDDVTKDLKHKLFGKK